MSSLAQPADGSRRATWAALAAVAVVVVISAWYRTPGFTQGGFASHDVAGILYNGMLLHDGALPYVDSLELKAPGTFWLAKWLAGPNATDIARFQIWANAWGLASLVALAAVAWRTFGPRAAVVAAVVYALHDAHLDSMDANYVTWAQLPAIVAVGWALAATRAPTSRAAAVGWLVAGVMAGIAMLLKRPGIATAGWLVVVAAWQPGPGRRRDAVGWVLAGIVAAHVPLATRYLAAGELATLLRAYGLSDWGFAYVAKGGRTDGTPAIVDGAWATMHVLVLPAALAAASWRPPARDPDRRAALALWAWLGATLAAASVGARFYKGYFLPVAAPMCLLAAVPWGLLGTRSRLPWIARVVVLLPALVLVGRQTIVLEQHRAGRARPHDLGGRRIAEHVAAHSQPGDRIWVWGWHLWDVYPLTGLRSGSRVYKSLGILSVSQDDTWRLPSSRLKFHDGPWARTLIEELRASRPVWIVLGSTVPWRDFRALQQLLHEEYRIDRRVRLGRVQFWWRADRAEAHRTGGAGRASSSSGS